jgi:lipopolysaccharide assembly outer membrane protein LptD (OstA)
VFPKLKNCIILLIFLFAAELTGQETKPDSAIVIPDSLADSSFSPLKAAKPAPKSELTGPIKYWAEKINLSDDGNRILLEGDAKIVYEDMTLTAAHILINRGENTLHARGVPDSVDADSNIVYKGNPVFEEKGDEPLNGDIIEYNFKTKRGKITSGKTKMDPGYYRGERINKISENTLLVKTGYFTSCEYIDDPHFYFKSSEMRVKVKDKVVAEPIMFYIADVPLMWFPFGIFPNKRGRHSGIVVPKYGENRVGGRFLRDMGYYWAPNDYFDMTLLTDFYDKIGFTYSGNVRYNLRYKLSGSLSGEYYPRDPSTGLKKERWRFRYSHQQTIDPTMSISGSGSFVSDKNFAKQLSPNVDDRLNQNLSSNLSLSKRWKGTKNSMSLSLSRKENLKTGRTDYTFPNLSFNRSQSTLYETITGESVGSKRTWYQNINFSYNSNLIRRGSKVPLADSSGLFDETTEQGIRHQLSFNSPQKLFKYFNLTPSVSYREDWVDEINVAEYNSETKLIEQNTKKQFAARRTFSGNLGVKTTLYGLFEPKIGSLQFIRHKLDPSISFNFAPDFSSPFYGYYNTVRDSNGTIQKFDKFKGSPFGGTPSSRQESMSIRLGNVFQGKLIDEDGKESKIDLLTMNFSSGYNFLADSLRWSNISSNFRTKILGKNIDVRTTHTFYKPRSDGTGYINKFETIPRLLSLSTSLGFSISNKTFQKKEDKKDTKKEQSETDTEDEDTGLMNKSIIQYEERDYMEETKKIDIPWSTSFNINYSLNKSDVKNPVERIDLSTRANFQLTKNWKISWNARFDLVKKDITTNSFSIYRDLHCWEMAFDWQPERGYYSFQINVKASALQDIKVTKHPSRSTYIPTY